MKKAVLLWFIFICGSSVLFSQKLIKVKPLRFDKEIEVDASFYSYLYFMGNYADKNNLNIIVTGDGFRKAETSLTNTVVNPAKMSNHLVGHAIDINIMYNGILYNSSRLGNFSTLPQPIKDFITECKGRGMRWGGDFSQKDPVHFDSGFNINFPVLWERMYYIFQSQITAPKKIDISGTWVGVDNNYMFVFNGSNYILKQKNSGWINEEKGTFYTDTNQTKFYKNITHYWKNGNWVEYIRTVKYTYEMTILSNNRFRIFFYSDSDADEIYEKQ